MNAICVCEGTGKDIRLSRGPVKVRRDVPLVRDEPLNPGKPSPP